jgi:eukaryotic-like serine/threonine-protein kinase
MVLGRYELLLPIAQGGMATVWAARQKGSRGFTKTVAIKTMLPGLSDDPQFEEMFLDEAGLAAKIQHPNVTQILDLGEEMEILYIVMEWVDGEALSTIASAAKKGGKLLPQSVMLRIISQACAGLHAAHELKDENDRLVDLVHRDVSPQNILVTYDGIVKLVDFGVAKAIGRMSETQGGQLKGKVPYMSPEQARGTKCDRRTDIFALGIVLYKLTLGVHPFAGPDDLATLRNIVSRPALPPRAKDPTFSPELEQVILKCLDKDPDRRFQTMLELDRSIERVLASTGASLVDDEVGAFVRSLLGERGHKRRSAIRDAVKAADERAAGAVVHETVSEIVMTNMTPGMSSRGLATPPSSASSYSGQIPPPPLSSQSSFPMPETMPSGPPTAQLLAPVELPMKRSRSGLFMAIGGALVVAGIVVFIVRFSAGPDDAQSGATAAQPTSSPTPTTVEAPAASTSAAAGGASAPSLNVNDLPDEKPGTAAATAPATVAGGGYRKPPPGSGSDTGGTAKNTPATTATAATTTKPSTKYVPKVTNPGF